MTEAAELDDAIDDYLAKARYSIALQRRSIAHQEGIESFSWPKPRCSNPACDAAITAALRHMGAAYAQYGKALAAMHKSNDVVLMGALDVVNGSRAMRREHAEQARAIRRLTADRDGWIRASRIGLACLFVVVSMQIGLALWMHRDWLAGAAAGWLS